MNEKTQTQNENNEKMRGKSQINLEKCYQNQNHQINKIKNQSISIKIDFVNNLEKRISHNKI